MNKLEMLEKILNGRIALIEQFDCNQPALLEDNIVVKPRHVKKMINKYLQKEVNEVQLQCWANFICIRGEYTAPGDVYDDKTADYYEPMFYVIQKLSTPELDGAITPELVKQYIQEFAMLKEPEDLDPPII